VTGVGQSLRRALTRLKDVAVSLFERYLGIHTGGDIRGPALGCPHGFYRASSWLVLWELFRGLEVGEDEVFVDIGSGMGRVLFMAARRPFKRVIGVERSDRLNEVARRNIERNRHRLACKDIEFVSTDALDWEVPDDLTVVYLFCPFPTPVFERLVERLVASIDRAPRTLRIVYFFSTREDREILMASRLAHRVSFRVPRYIRSQFAEMSMFRLVPGAGDRAA